MHKKAATKSPKSENLSLRDYSILKIESDITKLNKQIQKLDESIKNNDTILQQKNDQLIEYQNGLKKLEELKKNM